MRLCDQCLAKHPELEARANHPHDFGICSECLQDKAVRFVFNETRWAVRTGLTLQG